MALFGLGENKLCCCILNPLEGFDGAGLRLGSRAGQKSSSKGTG